ncbi:hypothetical protein NEOLEDRAFT_1136795 [Neolentinus lepideus HHB14362 ss-1]|uniref:Pentacotripeptide-repeat region of PRORP domain-containing protein n=1 Tax=Neolentinus lepideus HHB14362 ss-1 TaxID=1314782 RepID=A0A165R1H3_9AGAM|nr:hypothetical protein NEOLEDRAFT_1136795 [Neolentinus lepideus HHB14362 ss-1]
MSSIRNAYLNTSLRTFMRSAGCVSRPCPQVIHRNASTATRRARKLLSQGRAQTEGMASANAVGTARVNNLLLSVKRYLESAEDEEKALGICYSRLSAFEGCHRATAHEKAVLLFMEYEHYEDAFSIYENMTKEGLLPSAALRARMLALSMAFSLMKEDEAMDGFQRLFAEGQVDERTLREVLQFMEAELGAEFSFIRTIAKIYSNSRGKGFKFGEAMSSYLVYANLAADVPEGADVAVHEYAEGQKMKNKVPEPDVYTARLDALLESDNYSGEDVDAILASMERDGVEPDMHVFNILMECEVRNHRYPKAFELYEYSMAHQNEKLRPDAFTFAHLFKALWRLHQPRNAHTRKYKRSTETISPRALFRSMISSHFQATQHSSSRSSTYITTPVLNLALFTFLQANDYPAAFITARSFRACGLDVNHRTFSKSFDILIGRIFRDVRVPPRHPIRQWMNRFLGYPLGPCLKASTSEAEVLAMIIGIGKEPRLSIFSPDYRMPDFEADLTAILKREASGELRTVVESEGKRYTVKPAKMFQKEFEDEALIEPETDGTKDKSEEEPHPLPLLASLGEDDPAQPHIISEEQDSLNMTSLERILRRATLAALPEGADDHPAKSVSAAILEAKKDMISPKREKHLNERQSDSAEV